MGERPVSLDLAKRQWRAPCTQGKLRKPAATEKQMFQTVTSALDWLGIIAFTVTGALVASGKQMDVIGFVVLGTVTGIGGGTLRDVLLGLPVFWVREPAYLITCTLVSVLVFFAAHIPQSRYRYLLWFDAIGLALFAVAEAEIATRGGTDFTVALA